MRGGTHHMRSMVGSGGCIVFMREGHRREEKQEGNIFVRQIALGKDGTQKG